MGPVAFPGTLYHYTTPVGLMGIVRDGQLWATDGYYLNDGTELVGGIDLAKRRLTELREQSSDSAVGARFAWLSHQIRNLGSTEHMRAYIASLTSSPDQLSQWRAYCRGGGYCIGFPTDLLKPKLYDQWFRLEECKYSIEQHHEIMEGVLRDYAVPWVHKDRDIPSDDVSRFQADGQLIWEILRAASQIKHESFAEEREYRIVSQPERGRAIDRVHFRHRNGMIIPYTTVALPDESGFWREVKVIVGPSQHPEEAKASVDTLFRHYRGVALNISSSTTPYREW